MVVVVVAVLLVVVVMVVVTKLITMKRTRTNICTYIRTHPSRHFSSSSGAGSGGAGNCFWAFLSVVTEL